MLKITTVFSVNVEKEAALSPATLQWTGMLKMLPCLNLQYSKILQYSANRTMVSPKLYLLRSGTSESWSPWGLSTGTRGSTFLVTLFATPERWLYETLPYIGLQGYITIVALLDKPLVTYRPTV